jgi:hypothetical protein
LWTSSGAGRSEPRSTPAGSLDGLVSEPVSLRLARTLRQAKRTQRLGSPRSLVGGLGEKGDHRLPLEQSAGRLSAADVHDAGCQHCGCESIECVAGAGPSGVVVEVEAEEIEERHGLRATTGSPSTLTHRCFLHQYQWHVLLLVQRVGWLQPDDCALGSARVDEGVRDRSRLAAGQGAAPGSQAAHHFRLGHSSLPRISRSLFGSPV